MTPLPIVVSAEPRPQTFDPEKYAAVVNVSDTPGLTFTLRELPAYWFPILETAYWGYAPFFGLACVVRIHKGSGKPVLVHCHGGLNRSPTVSYALLTAIGYRPREIAALAPLLNLPAIFEKNLKSGLIPKDIVPFLRLQQSSPESSIHTLLKQINSPGIAIRIES